jgi:hypothetical protein
MVGLWIVLDECKDRRGFTYWIVEWDVLHYRIGLWLLDIFSAIELSENRISYWRIQETIGLLDIMDISARNYRPSFRENKPKTLVLCD